MLKNSVVERATMGASHKAPLMDVSPYLHTAAYIWTRRQNTLSPILPPFLRRVANQKEVRSNLSSLALLFVGFSSYIARTGDDKSALLVALFSVSTEHLFSRYQA